MRNTTLATAIHEAGHAVVQLALPPAAWIDSIELFEPGGELLGIVNTTSNWQPFFASSAMSEDTREHVRVLAWKDTLCSLAGPISEARWRRFSRAGIALSAYHFAELCLGKCIPEKDTDLGRVRARLVWAHPGDEHSAFKRAWMECEELVAENWRAIKTIGRLLAARGRLSDWELLEVWADVKSRRAPSSLID